MKQLLENWKKFMTEQSEVLYHATFEPLLDSIRANGLGATKRTNWEDSRPGVVYLAEDPAVAESYAETTERVPEEWLEQIVILQISTSDLDPDKLISDENVIGDAGTLEYHGTIPPEYLS